MYQQAGIPVLPQNRKLLMVTHVVPYPPSAGNEHRIFKLLRWLREEGYQVILVLREIANHPIDARRVAELGKLVHRLHVIVPPHAERVAARAPVFAKARAVGGRIFDEIYNHLGGSYYTQHVRPWVLAAASSGLAAIAAREPRLEPFVARWRGRQSGAPTRSQATEIEDLICPRWFVDAAARLCAEYQPSAVMAQYIWMSRCLQGLAPGTLKLIDCHDLWSARAHKVEAHGIEDRFAISAAEELERLARGDVIIAIQDGERIAMEAMGLERRIITVGVDMEEHSPQRAPIPGRILCVAADNLANVEGLRAFLSKSWPCLLSAYPDATLQIVGRVTDHLHPSERTTMTRFIPDLRAAYDEAEIVINPVIAGTGLKIKTVEALAHGKPLVSWPNGVDGLDESAGFPCLVAAHWLDFTNKVALLLDNAALRQELADKARRYVRTHCHRQRVYGPLGAALAPEARYTETLTFGETVP